MLRATILVFGCTTAAWAAPGGGHLHVAGVEPVPTGPNSPTATWVDTLAHSAATYWALSPQFTEMSPFKIINYAAGASNLAILRGSPPVASTEDVARNEQQQAFSSWQSGWNDSVNCMQILYAQGSNAPSNRPQGGSEFYAKPLDITVASNVSLEYSIYFPGDFDFVKGGKLPGLYGGHKGCSGGNAAIDCFSTRMMWRTDGQGELYLYVPKDKQTPELCSQPPNSICNSDYGLSIGRGAWTFAKGGWTTIRQDIWLNAPGVNNGGFNIWINNRLVLSYDKVRYRENADTCGPQQESVDPDPPAGRDHFVTAAAASAELSVFSGWSSHPPPPPLSSSLSGAVSGPGDAGSTSGAEPIMALVARSSSRSEYGASASQAAVPLNMHDTSVTDTNVYPFHLASSSRPRDCSIGFIGMFFSTFFGGHTPDWSPRSDQYTYFKDFMIRINV